MIYLLESNKAFRFCSYSSPLSSQVLFPSVAQLMGFIIYLSLPSFCSTLSVVLFLCIMPCVKESEGLGLAGVLVCLWVQHQRWKILTAKFTCYESGYRELFRG